MAPSHAIAADEVVRTLGTDAGAGLNSAAAAERLTQYGRNELAQAPPDPWWRRLARQFADLLIWILIGAAVTSGALGEWVDALAILAIVILNGILGYAQEGRAERALSPIIANCSTRSIAGQFAVVTIPIFQPVFKVTPIAFGWERVMIVLLALTPVTFIEVAKLLRAVGSGERIEQLNSIDRP